jgi:hypothetical protein
MSDEIKARLPFGPGSPWYEFVQVYKALPLKSAPLGKYKEIAAHSKLIPAGITISSTITATEEVGRVSMPRVDADLISTDLRVALAAWGWEPLLQGTGRFVFRKTIKRENGASTMPMALPLILENLGVEPKQDWGN